MINIFKKRKALLFVLFTIFSLSIQAQRGLILFGNFGKDYSENMFSTGGGIIPADTSEIVQIHKDYTNREISLPEITYMKLDGKFMKRYTLGGYFSHTISNSNSSKNNRNWSAYFYLSHAENYNFLSLFKQKLNFYVGGELASYLGRERAFFENEFSTSLSLSAHTSIAYLHKNRYWFEVGLEKSLAGVGLAIPSVIRKTTFRFNNDLDEEPYPIRIGFGLLF
jgi:hypothetical protein